jgi:hypothetical protein
MDGSRTRKGKDYAVRQHTYLRTANHDELGVIRRALFAIIPPGLPTYGRTNIYPTTTHLARMDNLIGKRNLARMDG